MKTFIKSIQSGDFFYADHERLAGYIESVRSLDIPHDAKAADVKNVLEMMFGKRPPPLVVVDNKQAYVALNGVIGKGLTEVEKMMGGQDLNDFNMALETVAANPDVKTVFIDVDSIGGSVKGVHESAEMLRNLGKTKHTVSITDGDMLSAAYYIASQSNEVRVTPSSKVGSVGVFKMIPDTSKAYEAEGVKVHVIKSGKHKALGAPGTSPTDDQLAWEQETVNEMHADFKATVKQVRKYAKDEDMEGQVFTGKTAAKKGLVTGTVSDLSDIASQYA